MTNDGRDYEKFVALLHKALLEAENLTTQKNIEIQRNKKIIDACGIEREFDLYWEYELAGITYKTVIECKDYNSNIPLEKIDALIGKIRDIPDLRAVFATKKGYQSGAQQKADFNKIDLLIVREQNETDWHDSTGNPYIKTIHINMHIGMPATIITFEPLLDTEWAKKNTSLDLTAPVSTTGLSDRIFVENETSGEKYSLLELQAKLTAENRSSYGVFSKNERFENAFISGEGFRYKIKGYNLKYSISEPHQETMIIDFSKELIGVIEYLQKGTKKSIFKQGVIREALLPNKP